MKDEVEVDLFDFFAGVDLEEKVRLHSDGLLELSFSGRGKTHSLDTEGGVVKGLHL